MGTRKKEKLPAEASTVFDLISSGWWNAGGTGAAAQGGEGQNDAGGDPKAARCPPWR